MSGVCVMTQAYIYLQETLPMLVKMSVALVVEIEIEVGVLQLGRQPFSPSRLSTL